MYTLDPMLCRLLLESSKEQLAEEGILLLTHQIIMDIGVKWLNEESS